MADLAGDHCRVALQLAQTYGGLVAQHQSLEAQLTALERQLCEVQAAAQDALPAALATCPAAPAWEDLYARLARYHGVGSLLAALPLPGPADGAAPPTLDTCDCLSGPPVPGSGSRPRAGSGCSAGGAGPARSSGANT
jgi:hypothetical protein